MVDQSRNLINSFRYVFIVINSNSIDGHGNYTLLEAEKIIPTKGKIISIHIFIFQSRKEKKEGKRRLLVVNRYPRPTLFMSIIFVQFLKNQ